MFYFDIRPTASQHLLIQLIKACKYEGFSSGPTSLSRLFIYAVSRPKAVSACLNVKDARGPPDSCSYQSCISKTILSFSWHRLGGDTQNPPVLVCMFVVTNLPRSVLSFCPWLSLCQGFLFISSHYAGSRVCMQSLALCSNSSADSLTTPP